jgi:pyruvate dehydrogenase E2 component (dihydrolipoyllysine-residue acetyltransferase)
MATEVIIPQFGTSIDNVTLLAWLKDEGEEVKRGDVLCEVETDKATMEVESFVDGVLLKQVAKAGSEVQIGSLIAYIGKKGEELPETETKPEAEVSAMSHDSSVQQGQSSPGIELPKVSGNSNIRVSPKIRKLARDLEVNLSTVVATGKDGRVTEKDVRDAALDSSASAGSGGKNVTCSKNQLAVSRTIQKSYQEIIPLNVVSKIKMASAIAMRKSFQEEYKQKLAFDSIFIYAVSRTIKLFPRFCCYYENDSLVGPAGVNIGVAIGTEADLYIPVVKNADTKTIEEINREVIGFSEKANKGTLSIEEMADGVFTISNLGMYPVDIFNVIIPPYQSSAMAIGNIEELPVFAENTFSVEPVAKVMLSVDHRFINGRVAGEFIAEFKKNIEQV